MLQPETLRRSSPSKEPTATFKAISGHMGTLRPVEKAERAHDATAAGADGEDSFCAASCSTGASRTTGLLTSSGFRSVGPDSALALAITAGRAALVRCCHAYMVHR